MKKGQRVVKIIEGGGTRTATIQRIASVKKGVISLEGSCLTYKNDGYGDYQEIERYIPGFTSYLVEFDGGEEEKLK